LDPKEWNLHGWVRKNRKWFRGGLDNWTNRGPSTALWGLVSTTRGKKKLPAYDLDYRRGKAQTFIAVGYKGDCAEGWKGFANKEPVKRGEVWPWTLGGRVAVRTSPLYGI